MMVSKNPTGKKLSLEARIRQSALAIRKASPEKLRTILAKSSKSGSGKAPPLCEVIK